MSYILPYLFIDSVRLCNNRDDVDLAVELLHADEVEALEAVAVRGDEVEARVDPGVVKADRFWAYCQWNAERFRMPLTGCQDPYPSLQDSST